MPVTFLTETTGRTTILPSALVVTPVSRSHGTVPITVPLSGPSNASCTHVARNSKLSVTVTTAFYIGESYSCPKSTTNSPVALVSCCRIEHTSLS